jgi:hypothetical protein
MGVMRYSKNYPNEIMEKTSQLALENKTYSFKYFKMIIKQITGNDIEEETEKIIQHDNVRGSEAYVGGGIHA